MEAVKEKKYVWVKPDRKMTMEELWARFEYDPDYVDEDPAYERAFFDRYGNPTYGTLSAMYEDEHNIGYGPFTMEEFDEWLDEVRAEADTEMEAERNYETDRRTQQISA